MMDTFKRGAILALGGLAALTMVGLILAGAIYAFKYFTADHERIALVEKVAIACRNGRGNFVNPPSDMDPIVALGLIDAQKDGLAECGLAKIDLQMYDMGIKPKQ